MTTCPRRGSPNLKGPEINNDRSSRRKKTAKPSSESPNEHAFQRRANRAGPPDSIQETARPSPSVFFLRATSLLIRSFSPHSFSPPLFCLRCRSTPSSSQERKKIPAIAHITRIDTPANVPAPRPRIPPPAIPQHPQEGSSHGLGGRRWSTRKSVLTARPPMTIKRVPPPALDIIPINSPLAPQLSSKRSDSALDPAALSSLAEGSEPPPPPAQSPSLRASCAESDPPTPALSSVSTLSDSVDDSPPHTPITLFAISDPSAARPLSALLPESGPFLRRVSSVISLLPSTTPPTTPAMEQFDITHGDPFATNEQSFFVEDDIPAANVYNLAVYAQPVAKSPENQAAKLPIWEAWARLSRAGPVDGAIEGIPHYAIAAADIVEKKSRAKERAQFRRVVLANNGGGYTTPIRTPRTLSSASSGVVIRARPFTASFPVGETCARADFLRSLTRTWFATAPVTAQTDIGQFEPNSNAPHVETDARIIVRERYRRSKQIDELIELVDSHVERRSWDFDIELGIEEEGDTAACVVEVDAV
ncbi:hypothetical protein OF83DRAFT_189265 [Amylostereum chailletii]|nr:hypothetical protein OF83DRAFT_189265 [Amylostereum chailletii]